MTGDLSRLFKAYDVRGTVPDELDDVLAREIGAAFAFWSGADTIVVVRDMRPSSPGLAEAFTQGAISRGVCVIDAGLGSTDMLYFAAGDLGLPGAMFTASHNPAGYNGIKLCLGGAVPVGLDGGLREIRELVENGLPPHHGATGRIIRRELLSGYAAHLRGLVDLSGIRPLKVVVDAANGMGGHIAPAVLGDAVLPGLPVRIVPLYFELDGTFPNHEANPLDPANLADLREAVTVHQADAGLAFDGDADRCFLVDERGEPVPPSVLIALIATRELTRYPGSAIVHNLNTSRAVPEIVMENGGRPVRSRVGHSFMKNLMAEHDAAFGGEHSGHYFFRDFWRADTGMLAALHALAALGGQDRPLSEVIGRFSRYAGSGELNERVADPAAVLERVAELFQVDPDAVVDQLDGVTVSLGDSTWFNLRPSNTEPLLRINVEAPDLPSMVALRDKVLSLVRDI